MKLPSERFAARALLLVLGLMLVFHALVLTGVVSDRIVWGGRTADAAQLRLLELVAVGVTASMLAVVAKWAGVLRVGVPPVVLRGALWLMTALFGLNTVGNLASESAVEKMVFTPVALGLALLCLRLALGKPARAAA